MENMNGMSSLEGETSTLDVSHHSARPPPPPPLTTTQEILLTSSHLQSINTTPIVSPLPTVGDRYTYTAPLVTPVAQFNAIGQSPTQVIRSVNLTHSNNRFNNRFVFMPTPSLPPPPINIRSANIANHFGVTNHPIRNQRPSSPFFPSCRHICVHCEICHNCPIRRWSSYLGRIPPNVPLAPRIPLPYYMHHYQPLNTPINPNQNYGSSSNNANLAPDSAPRACSDEAARTNQMPAPMYKCSVCNIEFPTAQAYGGHMSSHSKARKAQFGIDENWVRTKRARAIPQGPMDPDHDQPQSSSANAANDDTNYLEVFDLPQEVTKEDAFDEEEDEELKYLIDDVANAEPLRRDLE